MKMEGSERRPRTPVWVAAALLGFASAPSAFGQFGPPPKETTVIQGGTIHVGNGDVIEGGSVVIRGSRIDAVGKGLAVPEGAKVIDAAGKHIYPGLIDAESALMVDHDSRVMGEGQPTHSIVDALDPFADDAIEETLRGGVTTVYVAPHRGLVDGTGAVLKLKPRKGPFDLQIDRILRKEVAVTVTLGLTGDRPSMRLREWKTLGEQFVAAKRYIEAWDDYGEKLEEYKKELEKAKKEEEERKKSGKKEEPPPAPPTPPESKEPKTDKKEEVPPTEPPERRRPRRRPDGKFWSVILSSIGQTDLSDDGDGEDPEGDDPDPQAPRRHALSVEDGVSYALAEGQTAPQQGGEKKEEGLKKPNRPGKDARAEVLRKVLEGKLPLRVSVDHAADILNLLELKQLYHFDLVITGGEDADKVASELSAAGVPVVLTQTLDLASDSIGDVVRLTEAGIPFALTTPGFGANETRFLAFVGAAAIAGGLGPEAALAAVTSHAAELLGVADHIGTIEAGKDADLVITQGEIFSSAMTVERVFIDGATVVAR